MSHRSLFDHGYRFGMLIYPPSFRARFGEDMTAFRVSIGVAWAVARAAATTNNTINEKKARLISLLRTRAR